MIEKTKKWAAEHTQEILTAALLVPLFYAFWFAVSLALRVVRPESMGWLYLAALSILLSIAPSLYRALKQANARVREAESLVIWDTSFIKLWGIVALTLLWLFLLFVVAWTPFSGLFGIKTDIYLRGFGAFRFLQAVVSSILMLPLASYLSALAVRKGWVDAALARIK